MCEGCCFSPLFPFLVACNPCADSFVVPAVSMDVYDTAIPKRAWGSSGGNTKQSHPLPSPLSSAPHRPSPPLASQGSGAALLPSMSPMRSTSGRSADDFPVPRHGLGGGARGVKYSREELLSHYTPSLLPPSLEPPIEGVTTRDSLNPATWGGVPWDKVWSGAQPSGPPGTAPVSSHAAAGAHSNAG